MAREITFGERRPQTFSLAHFLEELEKSDSSGSDTGSLSALDSCDSCEEAAFEDWSDPLQDFACIVTSPVSQTLSVQSAPLSTPQTAALPTDTPATLPPAVPSAPLTSTPATPRKDDPAAPTATLSAPRAILSTSPGRSPAKRRRSVSPTSVPALPRWGSEPVPAEERWMSATQADAGPVLHKFRPRRTPGPQLDLSRRYSPLELFQLYFTADAVQSLCTNTNKQGYKRNVEGKKFHWSPVSEEEMYNYLGVVVFMGLVSTHTVRDYWSPREPYRLPFCPSVMSRKRYEAITCNLRMSDPEDDLVNDRKKGTPGYDRLFRVRPLLDTILLSCRAHYHPHRSLSIGERMVPTKAKIGLKQCMQAKPTKWGFKLLVLAESSNGYTFDFSIYGGKCASPSGKGIGYDAVMDLMKVQLLGTGYHVYVDSFYTSATLFQELHQLKFGACGPIREHYLGFPRSTVNALPKRATRGEMRWLRRGPLLFVKWMDTEEVAMCSTIHAAYAGDTARRRVRQSGRTWTMQSVTIPAPVKAYSQNMGGEDLSDALMKYYCVQQRTKSWYKAIFYHLLDIAVVNSFLLHKEMALKKKAKPLTQKKFREVLCLQLANIGAEEAEEASASDPEVPCFPVCVREGAADPSKKATEGRKYCTMCKYRNILNKTIWMCENCSVPLCIIPDRNCFRDWHVMEEP